MLITDGKETCKSDPEQAIRTLVAQGLDVRVNIIGFDIDDQDLKRQIEGWATLGNGASFDAANSEELAASIAAALAAPFRVLDGDGLTVGSGTVGGAAVPLPPGRYRVEVLADPIIVLDDVEIPGRAGSPLDGRIAGSPIVPRLRGGRHLGDRVRGDRAWEPAPRMIVPWIGCGWTRRHDGRVVGPAWQSWSIDPEEAGSPTERWRMYPSRPESAALALAICLALCWHTTTLAQPASPSPGLPAEIDISPITDQSVDDSAASGMLEWVRIATPGIGKQAILNAVATLPNGEVVVVGFEGNEAFALRSADGLDWESVAMPGPKRSDPAAVAAWRDGFVAGRSSFDRRGRFTGLVWMSPDGATWSEPIQLKDAWLFDVDATPGGLVVTGQHVPRPGRPGSATMWTSSDAESWQRSEGPDVALIGDLVVAPWGEWLLLGWGKRGDFEGEPSMWRSADGAEWTRLALPIEANGSPGWINTTKFSASDGALLLGVTSSAKVARNANKDLVGGIWQLTDGMEWRRAAIPRDRSRRSRPDLRVAGHSRSRLRP